MDPRWETPSLREDEVMRLRTTWGFECWRGAAVLGVLALTAVSCSTPATLDTVAEAIERSGRALQSLQGVNTELEALYEGQGSWTLLVVPATGVVVEDLNEAGVPEPVIRTLHDVAARRTGEQYLMEVRGGNVLVRALAEDAVKVSDQFVVSGRGAAWLRVDLKTGEKGAPAVTSFSIREDARQ